MRVLLEVYKIIVLYGCKDEECIINPEGLLVGFETYWKEMEPFPTFEVPKCNICNKVMVVIDNRKQFVKKEEVYIKKHSDEYYKYHQYVQSKNIGKPKF